MMACISMSMVRDELCLSTRLSSVPDRCPSDLAAELDAKRAIDQGVRLAAVL